MYHEHPLRILRYSVKNIWLLIFPLIRGINAFRLDRERLYNWIIGAWMDIIVIGLIILFGLVRWYYSRIDVTSSGIIHNNGIIIKLRTLISYSSISSVTVEQPFYLVPFNAIRIRCDTSAGNYKAADMKLMVSRRIYREIIKNVPEISEKNKIKEIPEPNAMSIFLFALFFSSGLSGTLYISAIFFKGGELARDIITTSFNRITKETIKISDRLLLSIPDAAVTLGVFFIIMRTLSIVVNLFKYSRFFINCDEKCLKISYGILNRREYRLTASHINYTDLRQNLIMKLLGAAAVNISCAGYGTRRNNNMPVLLPVKKEKDISSELEKIGVFTGIKNDFRTKLNGIWQYTWQPVIISTALFPLFILISRYYPDFYDFLLFITIMLEIGAIWHIPVKLAAFFTSGISVYDDKIMLRYCKWTAFHCVIAERKKIVKIQLEQTIFQKIRKRSNVTIWFEGEHNTKHKIKAMDINEMLKFTALLDYDISKLL